MDEVPLYGPDGRQQRDPTRDERRERIETYMSDNEGWPIVLLTFAAFAVLAVVLFVVFLAQSYL